LEEEGDEDGEAGRKIIDLKNNKEKGEQIIYVRPFTWQSDIVFRRYVDFLIFPV
jgi:hypothetical protein